MQVEGSDVCLSLEITCSEALKVSDSQETKLKALVAFYEPIYTNATLRLCFSRGNTFQQGHKNHWQSSVSNLVIIWNDMQATEWGWSGLECK